MRKGARRIAELFKARHLSGIIILVALCGLKKPTERPYLSPALDVIVAASESTVNAG